MHITGENTVNSNACVHLVVFYGAYDTGVDEYCRDYCDNF